MDDLKVKDIMQTEVMTVGPDTTVREVLEILCKVLAPLAPFLGEAFWEMLGGTGSVFRAPWPEPDPEALRAEELEIVVQVNGKVRGKFVVPAGASEEDLRARALELPALRGQTPRKVIVVKGRLVNVVV